MNNLQSSIFNFQSRQRGYTLLFAVLVAALVLGVAVFILEISTKQYELSASARDSMYSYYAADSGIECVSLNNGVYSTTTPLASMTCGKSSSVPIHWTSNSARYTDESGNYSELQFNLDFGQGSSFNAADTCADVTIDEYYTTDGTYHDIVQSRGYNHCSSSLGPDTANPNTVERALQLSHSS
jgi:hypothetical protein